MRRLTSCVLAATLAFTSFAVYSTECPNLSISQRVVLAKSWKYGEETLGKGWGAKMGAVAYQESKLGLDIHGKGSYGVFQLQPSTVAFMNNRKSTAGIKKRLNNEFQYSATQAAKYLDYWRGKGYPDHVVYRRYNGGYSDSSQSKYYSRQVKRHTKMFNQCYVYDERGLHAKRVDG